VATNSITGAYSGDTLNAASTSSALSVTSQKATSSIVLASSTNPSTFGASLSLTATVSGYVPSGTVTFMDGSTTLGKGSLNNGVATYSTAALTSGSHSLSVVYAGDANNATSTSSTLSQTVNSVATTTALTSSVNPSVYAGATTLTATVTGAAPTGVVNFMDGAATLGTGTLSGGVASLSIATLTTGSHSLTAAYAGNANNASSTSATLAQTVNTVTSTIGLVSSANPSSFSGSVSFTATVTGFAPTGMVTFKDGATTLGSGTLSSGVASFTSTALATGTHSITAVYGGDTNNSSSTSSALTQSVNAVVTTTALTSSVNPSTYGGPTTLTASIAGGVAPSGVITFKDGATVLGTGTVSGTTASLVISTLSGGTHSLSATYGGDVNNASSTSAALTQTVNTVSSSVALTSSVTPSIFGASVTFTATVSAATPSGAVTFKDGASTLGSGTLTGGVASFTSTALAIGTHAITAVYAGDGNNAAATSIALSQIVSGLPTSITLASSVNPSAAGTPITLTASVSASSPTGGVTFMDGATTIGTAPLSSGVASLTLSTLAGGSHSLSAVYAGDSINAASTSGALVQVVTLVSASVSLNATPSTPSFGELVSLSAIVSGSAATGSVTFMDGATSLGSASLNASAASFNISSLAVGSHSITAVYSGDAANQGATSLASTLTVLAVGGSPNTMTWQYGYDAMGRPTTVVDPNGLSNYTYYDSLGRPIQIQQPANTGASIPTVTSLAYNLGDSLTTVTDPRSLSTSYSPNGLGQVTAQSSPDSGVSGFTYDAVGNLTSKTDARGQLSTMTYDALNRLSSVAYTSGVGVTLTYGTTPGTGALGELTSITDESGSIGYGYDAAGRMTTKTQSTNGMSFVTGYTWGDSGSAMDKLIAITYPSGNQVNYSYDSYGQVSGVSVTTVNANGAGGSGAVLALLGGVTSNASYQLTGWSWASGNVQSIAYDGYGQMVGYNLGKANGAGSAAGAQRTVVHDAAGRITGFIHSNNGAGTPNLDQSFTYDNLNRLVSSSQASGATQYSYDANGNRTAKVVNGSSYANTISGTSNQLNSARDVLGNYIFSYDASGNVTSDGVNTFTYSPRGRMASVTTPGGQVNYLYNALEQRVYKSGPTSMIPNGAAYYVYDEAGKVLGEYDGLGNPVFETLYLGNLPVGVIKQTGTAANANIAVSLYQVYADHLGAPRVITDTADNIVWRWDTAEAFGATAANQNPNGAGTFAYDQRLPGQVFDTETGLFDNWHRTYDPRGGRYRQSDPIGLNGGINTYSYVAGNPLSYTDPKGLQTYTCTRPLKGLGGFRWDDVHLFHEYVCTRDTKTGLMTCGGIGPSGSALGSPAVIEPDAYTPDSCEKRADKNSCIEACVQKRMSSPLPTYDVFAGTKLGTSGAQQCQIFAEDTVSSCISSCLHNFD
jgi:RHS repeat-associated protein